MSRLSHLSNQELVSRLEKLLTDERASTLDIMEHLGEVERRRLHVNLGYDSLFAYCTEHLRYPAAVAGRTIQTVRCIRRFPEVRESLQRGEVSTTTIALVSRILDDNNKREILERIRNKSQREVEMVAMRYRPASALRDRVRSVCVVVPRTELPTPLPQRTLNDPPPTPESDVKKQVERTTRITPAEPAPAAPETTERVTIERRALIQFLAGREFMRKFEKVRALLSTRLPATASFEAVLGAALDVFLDRHSPERRAERREKRRREAPAPSRGRHIPTAVRDAVFARDGGRCTFVAPDGKRCNATHYLHVDHITPFALGGGSVLENLRLLCARHNQLEAERHFGVNIAQQRHLR